MNICRNKGVSMTIDECPVIKELVVNTLFTLIKGGYFVTMDPYSGEVLATANEILVEREFMDEAEEIILRLIKRSNNAQITGKW
jgi:hypothetical protein